MKNTINDNQSIKSVVNEFGRNIPFYDDGFGPMFVYCDEFGVTAVIRAQTENTAYEIAEDEFMLEADSITEIKSFCGIDDENTLFESEIFEENFGFRPNGPNVKDTIGHGIYQRSHYEKLYILTERDIKELKLTITLETNE